MRMNYESDCKKDIWTTHATIVKRKLLIAVITLNVYYLDHPLHPLMGPRGLRMAHYPTEVANLTLFLLFPFSVCPTSSMSSCG